MGLFWTIPQFKILGENGTFRIQRGNDDCGFESNIVAGLIRLKMITYFDYRNSS
jgi:hypothetical protein